DEVGGRDSIDGADLATEEGGAPAEAHGADAKVVGRLHDLLFQRGELRHGIDVVEPAEELGLGPFVTGGAIASDADAKDPGSAPLALRLENRVEDRAPAAVEIAIRAEGL